MLILRLCQVFALWGLVGGLGFYAWMTSVATATTDARTTWGMGLAAAAWAAGQVTLATLRRFRPRRWPRLGALQHGLALIVTALCAHAISHVSPQFSVKSLKEEVPLLFLPLYPLVAGLTPLLLSSGARSRSPAHQTLLVVTALFSLSGAPLFMDPAVAAWLGLLALLVQLGPGSHRPRGSLVLALAAGFTGLCILAGLIGHNPFAARPAVQWIIALSSLGLAVALQPRDERSWRDLLSATVVPAVVVAVCGALVTAALAGLIAPGPALHTRLYLFRQHPNFLAPYFGFHAVLALGLAAPSRGLRRWAWIASALLLIASTVLTDSRTGTASMALAIALIPGFYLATALARRLGRVRLLAGLTVALLLVSVAMAFGGADKLASRLNRFEASMDFRIDAWRNALLVIEQNPVLGIGPHTFVAVAEFAPGSRFYNARDLPHPHDVLLYVGQSAGLPALAIFVCWLLAVLGILVRRALQPADPVSRPLLVATLAALAGLIAANVLDLGLALLSVAPAPLFLLTGLVAAPTEARDPSTTRPWHGLAWTAVLAGLLIPFAARPLFALGLETQSLLLSYESDQRLDPRLKRRAVQTLETALELSPMTPTLHGLLATWREQEPGGFPVARELLEQRIALAPRDGQGHSLLARLYLRLSLWDQAEPELLLALADTQGGPWKSRDRASLIQCVAQLGRREEALELLIEAMQRDLGVLAQLQWMDDPQPPHRLAVAAGAGPPIELTEAAELLFQRDAARQLSGHAIGRAAWMDLYRSFRIAGRDDRAGAVLDWLESNAVGDIEVWALEQERGELALSGGAPGRAKQHFERAIAIRPDYPFYRQRLAEATLALGEPLPPTDLETAMRATGEILDRAIDFRGDLDGIAAHEIEHGDPATAAATLERTLMFEDDPPERAHLWERIGDLYQQAGQADECERAMAAALQELAAKPYRWRDLQLDLSDSVPQRIARTLTAAWRSHEPLARVRLRRAWGLPDFFGSRQGPSLFRLGFYAENGLTDHLLREAELQLLIDPDNVLAHWMRLAGLEAAYDRLDELPTAMRTLVEVFEKQFSVERQFNQLAGEMQATRMEDPKAWTLMGQLSLLRGRYAEAIGMFDKGRELLPDDPAGQARIYGWEALAAYLAEQPERALECLKAGVALDPSSDLLKAQLIVAQGRLTP